MNIKTRNDKQTTNYNTQKLFKPTTTDGTFHRML